MDDDSGFPDLAGPLDAEGDPTAHGIVQCLRMLAEEASSLQLGRTLAALRAAMRICADEGKTGDVIALQDDALLTQGLLLH